MRDNTPTDRLDNTPASEQDLSTTPELDFEFQEGEETILAHAALPQVARIIPGAVFPAVTVELESGVSLALGEGTRAALHLGQPDGLGVLVLWEEVDTAYAVPAALLPDLLPYFPGLEADR